ncbi:MAG: glycosyltransferase family 4 protein [Patescibacteria group bacterium]
MKLNNSPIKVCRVASVDMTLLFLLMQQMKFLQRQGYDVSAVCSPGELIPRIEAEGIRVKTIEIQRRVSPIADLASLWKLFWYFRKEHFDIVHTHTPKASLLGQVAAWLARVPIRVNTIHGMYVREDSSSRFKWLVFSWIERVVAFCSHYTFSINNTDIETLVREGIYKKHRITYLGTGVSLERFDPAKFSEADIKRKKEKLGIPLNKKVVGIVARLVREKGYPTLFEAFRSFLQEYPDSVLLIVGPADPVKKDSFNPNDMAREYDVAQNTIILGQRFDVEELYPLMDVFVLPSLREGIGSSTLQASAMERPVVVSDIRGCQESVDHQKTGLLVPPRDSRKLAEALSWVFSHSGEASEMGKRGREKVAREFAEDGVFQRMRGVYERLIQEKL